MRKKEFQKKNSAHRMSGRWKNTITAKHYRKLQLQAMRKHPKPPKIQSLGKQKQLTNIFYLISNKTQITQSKISTNKMCIPIKNSVFTHKTAYSHKKLCIPTKKPCNHTLHTLHTEMTSKQWHGDEKLFQAAMILHLSFHWILSQTF